MAMTLLGRAGSGLVVLIAALGFWSAPATAGDSLRCGSRIVSVEALQPAVRAACGEPSYRDAWTYSGPDFGQYVADTEVWTYNFGPNQLLRVLRFHQGRLVDIDTDGYGFFGTPDDRCEPNDLVEGLSKYRLVVYCGEPAARHADNLLAPYRPRNRGVGGLANLPPGYFVSPVYREEWIYNFGSRYLLRRVILENGRVVDVENGERGYDVP